MIVLQAASAGNDHARQAQQANRDQACTSPASYKPYSYTNFMYLASRVFTFTFTFTFAFTASMNLGPSMLASDVGDHLSAFRTLAVFQALAHAPATAIETALGGRESTADERTVAFHRDVSSKHVMALSCMKNSTWPDYLVWSLHL